MKQPTDNQRGHWPYIWTLAATALILWLGSLALGVNRADATEGSVTEPVAHATAQARWQQPYGGCKEAWQAPHSAGADECRAHGWVISARLVVGPHRVVRYSALPECKNEDRGRSCSWNFDSTYADNGRAYWFGPKGRIHYAWPLAEVRTWQPGWEWVDRELGDALAESGYRNATRRHWGRCNVVWGDTTVITCPDWFQVVS